MRIESFVPMPDYILPACPPTEDGRQLPTAILTRDQRYLWRYGVIEKHPRALGYIFWNGHKLLLVKKSRYGGWIGIDRTDVLHERLKIGRCAKVRDAIYKASKEI